METQNTSHLVALQKQLAELKLLERTELVEVFIAQKQREISGEFKFLGIAETVEFDGSDDDLMNELLG